MFRSDKTHLILPVTVLTVLALSVQRHRSVAAEPTKPDTIRVAIYADKGALTKCVTQTLNCLPESAGFETEKLTAEDIREATPETLDKYDLLIFPGGMSSTQAKTLDSVGREHVQQFVKRGGGYIGICAGAYLASIEYPWSLGLLNAEVVDDAHWLRGSGDVQLKIKDAGQMAFGIDGETCYIHYENGPLLGPGNKDALDQYEPLATFETEIATFKNVPTGLMKGTTAIARGKFGDGRVMCFSPHPEKTTGMGVYVQAAARWVARQTRRESDNLGSGKAKQPVATAKVTATPLASIPPQSSTTADEKTIKAIRVALYADSGAAKKGSPKVLESLPKEAGFDLTIVSAEDIRGGVLEKYDVLIQPGGMGSVQAKTLREDGRAKIKEFVSGGGGYIGICAGAYLASANYSWSLGLLDARVVDSEHWARGTGQVTINMTPEGMKALGTDKEQCSIYYGQGPLLAPAEKEDINDYEKLASYETEIAKKNAPAGVMKGTTAIARSTYGKGRIQCFSPHPEKTPGLEPFLQAAVHWVANKD